MTETESDGGGGSADLGDLDPAILVFGGPYGNLEATEALLREAERHGIALAHVICTGDVAAYSADPQATADRLREAEVAVVMGNTDHSLGRRAEDCGCGYPEGGVCELLSRRWFAYAAANIDDETKRWLRKLPREIGLRLGGRRLSVVHGGLSRINRFVFPSTAAAEKAGEIAASGGDGVIAGHSGLPFTQVIGGRLWHNAGVIGQPANDGSPRVWYSTLRLSERGIRVADATHFGQFAGSFAASGETGDCRVAVFIQGSADGMPHVSRRDNTDGELRQNSLLCIKFPQQFPRTRLIGQQTILI